MFVFNTFALLINQIHSLIMKKSTLFSNALVAIFFASFVACSSPAQEEAPAEEAVVEEVVVEEEPVVEEVVVDSAAVEVAE
jgi:hypothetical protein